MLIKEIHFPSFLNAVVVVVAVVIVIIIIVILVWSIAPKYPLSVVADTTQDLDLSPKGNSI